MVAWYFRFIQDDAFISFRYADNFARGNGLVWNLAEFVEGYTNFLWTILIAVGLFLHLDPIIFSKVSGIVLYAITSTLFCLLTHGNYLRDIDVIAGMIIIGTSFTMVAYATGGLETQSATMLLLSLFLLKLFYQRDKNRSYLVTWSLTCALILLTHMDSAILVLPMGLYLILQTTTTGDDWKSRARMEANLLR
jgi:arabinofuranosyltransferase